MCNLLVTILNQLDVETAELGDSTGPLDLDPPPDA